jgi:predicted  nucleic acid-binding Zn-ribbon protein
MIGFTALMIAGCAGFFSVIGIGDLFEGNAPWIKWAVIIMASSLEVGKLVAASFLYRYWKTASLGLRSYLFVAVFVLMGITSFGIYGFLSKAFRDNDMKVDTLRQSLSVPEGEIALLEQHSQVLQRDINNHQQKILSHQGKISGYKDKILSLETKMNEREHRISEMEDQVETLRQSSPPAIPANEEQISSERTRLQTLISGIRKQIDDREDAKLQLIEASNEEINGYQKQALLTNERLVELDNAVKILTDKGPGGILKNDYVRRGEELRIQQKPERDALRQHIAKLNENTKLSRDRLQENLSRIDKRIKEMEGEISTHNASIGALSDKAKVLDDKAQAQHQQRIEQVLTHIASIENEVRGFKGEIENHHASIRQEEDQILQTEYAIRDAETAILKAETDKRPEEAKITRIFSEIDQTEIGAFKFIARSFFEEQIEEARQSEDRTALWIAEKKAMDSVVKWFIMVIVLVFDPLAVTLVVAFNVAMRRDGLDKKDFLKSLMPRPAFATLVLAVVLGAIYLRNNGHLPNSSPSTEAATSNSTDTQSASGTLRKFTQALFPSNHQSNSAQNTSSTSLPLHQRIPQDAVFVVSFGSFNHVLQNDTFTDLLGHGLSSTIAPNLSREWKNICRAPADFGLAMNQPVFFYSKFPPSQTPRTPAPVATYPASGLLFSVEHPGALEIQLAETLLGSIGGRWRVEIENGFKAFYHRDRRLAIGFHEATFALFEDPLGQLGDAGLREEIKNVFSGKGNTLASSTSFRKHIEKEPHLGIWFDGTAFFREMNRDVSGSHLYGRLRNFLDFESHYTVTFETGHARLDAQYFYRENRLADAGILSLRSALQDIRPGDAATAQDQLMLLCVEKLDYSSFSRILSQEDPSKNPFLKLLGLDEATENVGFSSTIETPTEGRFTLTLGLKDQATSSLETVAQLLSKTFQTQVSNLDEPNLPTTAQAE